jgi:uncharacterized protein (DUF58 family)
VRELVSTSVARIGAPMFSRLYRYDRALRRKLTPAGWVVAALLVACGVFGLNTKDSLIYQLFGLALGLLAVAFVASARTRMRLAVKRSLPPVVTTGIPFEYEVRIENLRDTAHEALRVEEVLAVPSASHREFVSYKVREDRSRNLFDRMVGYPRWVSLMQLKSGARVQPAAIEALGARAAKSVRLHCVALRRGELRFEAVRIARVEPLGLMNANLRIRLPETLLAMPRVYSVAPLQLPGSRRLQPGGVAFAGRVGDAEEFVSLRDYRPGDTPRRIHWKAWARTGRPVVKQYRDEYFVRHALLLDTFPSGDAAPFEAAVSLAASLLMMPHSSETLLDLVFVERRAYTLTQGRGLGAAADLLRVLATVTPSAGAFTDLAEAALLNAPRISAAICVVLSWDAPRRDLVARLRGMGIPVRVWWVRDEGDTSAVDPGPLASDPKNFRVVDAANLERELLRP